MPRRRSTATPSRRWLSLCNCGLIHEPRLNRRELLIGGAATLAFGAAIGCAAGLCWVTAGIAMTYIFEKRSLTLLLINGGYATLQFTFIGAILGAWH